MYLNLYCRKEGMDFGRLLCKIGVHKWTTPQSDVTRDTEYQEVCERCRKLR